MKNIDKRFWGILLLAAALPVLASCGGAPLVEVSVVDERTALENQILGSYEELGEEVILLASVRSVDSSGKLIKTPKIAEGKRRVIKAMQRASFNKDDIDRWKKKGVLGENREGGLTLLSPEKVPAGEVDFVAHLVKEENEDRRTIMLRVIETSEELSDKDLARVQKVFAALNRDKAVPGEMIESKEGEWMKKEIKGAK